MPADAERIQRVKEWQTAAKPAVPTIQTLLEGRNEPSQFSSYACLYPNEDMIRLFKAELAVGVGHVVTLADVHSRIAGLTVPARMRLRQRALLAEFFLRRPSDDLLWTASAVYADKVGLPVAFIAFGEAAVSGSPCVSLQAVATAPLDYTLNQFKQMSER